MADTYLARSGEFGRRSKKTSKKRIKASLLNQPPGSKEGLIISLNFMMLMTVATWWRERSPSGMEERLLFNRRITGLTILWPNLLFR